MKTFFMLCISLVLLTSTSTCDKNKSGEIETSGVITEQGITTYQYGTHVISSGYALRSSTVNLDDYLNKEVTVVGNKIEGYPVDGGPEFLEVVEVK